MAEMRWLCNDLSQGIGSLRISTEITVNVNTREVDVPAQSGLSTTQDGTTRLRASTTRGGGKAGATKIRVSAGLWKVQH